MGEQVTLTLERGRLRRRVDATRVHFSAHQCFSWSGGSDEAACARRLGEHLLNRPGLALYGVGPFFELLLQQVPALRQSVQAVITDGGEGDAGGLPVVAASALPAGVRTVFLCETRAFPRQQMRKRLPAG
ncbi:MAG TPA: hypothetical protein VMA53_06775, partial [Stellaceae bacterium]|nr:hypothetical protein [Stellaceae bacterium]